MISKVELLIIELDLLRLKVIEERKDFGDKIGYDGTERAYAIGKMDAQKETLTNIIDKLKTFINKNTGNNTSVSMMYDEESIAEWSRLRDLFYLKTSVPPEEQGLIKLNCFIEGYMAAKEEQKAE